MVLYDGECGFCSASIRYWMISGAGRVEFFTAQGGMGEPYGLHADQPMGSVHLIEADGRVIRGAEAIFRMMSLCGNLPGKIAWSLYHHVPLFRILSEWGYRRVAERRASLSAMMCRVPRNPKK